MFMSVFQSAYEIERAKRLMENKRQLMMLGFAEVRHTSSRNSVESHIPIYTHLFMILGVGYKIKNKAEARIAEQRNK